MCVKFITREWTQRQTWFNGVVKKEKKQKQKKGEEEEEVKRVR